MTKKSYKELILLPTFEERFAYLRLDGRVGEETFGWDRYLNQSFYRSSDWKRIRKDVIARDGGCDLADPEREIMGAIYIHHINPLAQQDVLEHGDCLFDLDNLICTSYETHQAIHYGTDGFASAAFIERKPNDTCPWK